MYIVTGGAGFIGSNLVAALNQQGENNVLVVDHLKNSHKFLNIRDLKIADFLDKQVFRQKLQQGDFNHHAIKAIFHQGACSDTMEYDGRYMMDNNYTYSQELFHFALEQQIPFIYASSAATYGSSTTFREVPENEKPLNIYGYSKLLFDRYVQSHLTEAKATVAGLRFFNVYGPREVHKGRMASMVHQLYHQLKSRQFVELFKGSGGYGDGEQRRDFISVNDIIKVHHFLLEEGPIQGIFNVGTGKSRSFNAIARTLIEQLGFGEIRYRDMPEGLVEKYQNFTEADISSLREAGFKASFTSLEEGIAAFIEAQQHVG
ncbi:ADP-glyceromanno-heptose 6-epimerase [Magnetococcales bacterium HHB-1]